MNDGYMDVLRSIASSEPTPGGGSVAALSLAHAHSLSLMVARLTLAKEKWVEGHDAAKATIELSEPALEEAILLAISDSEAFESVMSAYRLPKETEDEKKQRSEEIRNATIGAALAPLNTASSAQKLLSNLEKQSASCNPNALTDLASASEMALSAAKIASLNVRINLEYIEGEDVDLLTSKINTAVEQSIKSANIVALMVNKRLEW
ncbi:MAG: cyclodeaminase/cyclohydrolase family protein [Candidatus Thalassarchaeum sp.]|jgi:formiminotetrahydrofolate cyclodeaminase|nr:cyclodeaminase/cyclohydrolase family protein [Candidatus Thalassarchaeum sp.]|tara:strand:- start:866 stop:1486 length:621 start_codon:yes stop_codon:yes gene_type:complete